MAFFTWKKSFSVGIDDIDMQHRDFLDYLNQCHQAVMKDRQAVISGDLLNKLNSYVEEHFAFEEKIMEFADYPEIEQHMELHRYFTNEIKKLEQPGEPGENNDKVKTVLYMLRDWFLNHVLIEDKKYAPYI